jgi:protein-S-isoprenylcysteine O-methyltransferase Ste14
VTDRVHQISRPFVAAVVQSIMAQSPVYAVASMMLSRACGICQASTGPKIVIYPANRDDMSGTSAVTCFRAFFQTFRGTKLYDLLAATPLIAWYGFCLSYRIPALTQQIVQTNFATADVLILASLASKIATPAFFVVLALLLALRHKPRARTTGLYPRFAAVAGTYLGVAIVLLPPRDLSTPLLVISTLILLCGTVLAIYAALSLGRSLSMLPEARRLVTRGPYGLVRHPLYLSEAVALVGVTLQYLSPLAVAVLAIQCVFQLERIKSEERVMSSTFPEYRDYMATTARLVPGVY